METNSSNQMMPDVPPELAGPLPRRIRLAANTWYQAVAIPVVVAFTLILMFWVGKNLVQQMQLRSALRKAGADVTGEITGFEAVPKAVDDVDYTFTVNGRTFSGKAAVPPRVERTLYKSGPLMVRYLPSDPAINHPAAWGYSIWSNFFGVILLAIANSLLIVFPVLRYRRRQILAWGKPAVGVVMDCAPAKAFFSLKYEFRTEAGTTIRGKGWSGIRREIGANIWILYMPQNPRRNHPYPLRDYRVAG